MISVYNIKPKFQALLKPLLKWLYNKGISANGITWASIIFSILISLICWFFPSITAIILLPCALFIRMALNALDGMMARQYNMQSKKGELLNELGDVVSDVFMFSPLTLLLGIDYYLLTLFILLSVINEFTGVLGKVITGERRYEGPMGKSDRALLVGIICITYLIWPASTEIFNYIFIAMCALIVVSTSTRIYKMKL